MQNFTRKSWTSRFAIAKTIILISMKSLRASGVVSCLAAALSPIASAQLSRPVGAESAISGPLIGDQMFPHLSIQPSGGYVVWQDNFVDGNGFGIGARRLDNTLSPTVLASFRVNQQTAGNQERPQIAMLPSGAAAIVWQGGLPAYEHIWVRALNSNGTFVSSSEIRLNTYTNGEQRTPVIAALTTSNYAVAWASMHQDGSLQGIYMRLVDANGQPFTAPVQVNQFTSHNQRDPAIAALTGGGFVVAWVSEDPFLGGIHFDIYARRYNASGNPVGDEFRVNTGDLSCANPSASALPDGGFAVAWAQRDRERSSNWDIYVRSFAADGVSSQSPLRVNTYRYGDQYGPKIASHGNVQLLVWSSIGQDGSWEGVFGRPLAIGVPEGDEITNNTTTVSRQLHPAVASDGGGRLLVVWSSYLGEAGFDLLGQKYSAAEALVAPAAPFVSALSSSRLSVTWPPVVGFPIAQYQIYMDGAEPPAPPTAVVMTNLWTKTGLSPASTHTFRLAYMMEGGQTSPLSETASGTTWGEDENVDGLPDDWQERYFGYKPEDWPGRTLDSDGDGASNASEYLAGTDPTDPTSVLRTRLTRSERGPWLEWSTQPGCIYQIQSAPQVTGSWSNHGAARFAAGTSDSILVSNTGATGFYRIIRVR
jgi:hypothetical protein